MSVLSQNQLTGKDTSHIFWLDNKTGIHQDMVSSWLKMVAAAECSGFELKIASGFRHFDRQLSIWNRKFSGELPIKTQVGSTLDITQVTDKEKIEAILLYSAIPGASRHHWGCDIDVFAPNLLPEGKTLQLEPWEYQENGYFHPLTLWLEKHAHSFGFYTPYDKYRKGVAIEPWHLSYQEISADCEAAFTERMLIDVLQPTDISGKNLITSQVNRLFKQYIMNVKNVKSVKHG